MLRAHGLWDAPRVLLTGDFNVPPESAAFRVLCEGPLRDAFPEGRGATHWFGRRIDHVLLGPGLALLRPLDQGVARAAVRQSLRLDPLGRVRGRDTPGAPVSDHLPEGGVFRWVAR